MKNFFLIALFTLSVGVIHLLYSTGQNDNFILTSPGIVNQGLMSDLYACTKMGGNRSPELIWKFWPSKTKSFAVICNDSDAPGGSFIHWIYYNIPLTTHHIPEGLAKNEKFLDGSQQGVNSFGHIGYDGPCPPPGKAHHYHFILYALDSKLSLDSPADIHAFQEAIKGHILAQTQLIGLYQSPKRRS
jgi:Raf kinase inhibitor-like YbhB/YbcL family protein